VNRPAALPFMRSLSSVSAGISEALVETALGLAVAIPAVLAFNYLSNAIAHDERLSSS